ncbi:Transgelin-2 [Trichinella pseudospiralis]
MSSIFEPLLQSPAILSLVSDYSCLTFMKQMRTTNGGCRILPDTINFPLFIQDMEKLMNFDELDHDMANHGPAYGLSKEIQLKNQARFDLNEAREILSWVVEVTGISLALDPQNMDESEIAETLKDGTQLCALAEKVMGSGSIQYNRRPKMPFHMMENIANFLNAARKLGIPEITCFQTVDLYERKHMYKVFETLRWFSAAAMKKQAPVPVAKFAYKLSDKNPRHFKPEIVTQAKLCIPMQYGSNKGASQKGMRPYGAQRQIILNGK